MEGFPDILMIHEKTKETPNLILYGTHTGNSRQLAEDAANRFSEKGIDICVSDMDDFDVKQLPSIKRLFIIVSTDGEGDPPLMAEDLLKYLRSDRAPDLSHLSYAVLALGDTTYFDFCKAGIDFDLVFEKLGAKRLRERMDCDVDFEENYENWIESLLNLL